MPLVVGVDSSTSACKVQVRDVDTGAVVASGRAAHPPTSPPRSEQHPSAWEHAFHAACAEAALPANEIPAAISVAAQQHGLVVLGDGGEVLRPAKLWNDTESAPDTGMLLAALPGGQAGWATACGSVPLPSFTIAKLHWLRRCEPETFRRVATVLLPHDWLTFRLTGRRTTDRGDASGTGYWSPREARYRDDLLRLVSDDFDWDAALPEVLAPDAHGRGVAWRWDPGGRRDGRQHGGRPRPRPPPGRPRPEPGDERHRVHGLRRSDGRSDGRGGRLRRRDRPLPAAGLHHERDQGHGHRGAGARCRSCNVRRAGARGSGRSGRVGARPPPRRRADAESAGTRPAR